jgi:hypothetical protein
MARRCLIVANQHYSDHAFAELPGANADATALSDALTQPEIGDFDVEVVRDAGARVLRRAIESFFQKAEREDLLWLHLSCHGMKNRDNRLFLIAADTERDLLVSTGIDCTFISDLVESCRSKRVAVFLDCCYSGAYSRGLRTRSAQDSVDVADAFGGMGRVVITASNALQFSHESLVTSREAAEPSIFTRAIVNGLATGDADLDGDGWVSVDELYDYVYGEVRAQLPNQTPTRSVSSAEGTLLLAHNPRVSASRLPAELVKASRSTISWQRAGVLHELEKLLGIGSDDIRSAASDLLAKLNVDPDPAVAARARTIWASHNLGELHQSPTALATSPSTPESPTVVGHDQTTIGGPVPSIVANLAINIGAGDDSAAVAEQAIPEWNPERLIDQATKAVGAQSLRAQAAVDARPDAADTVDDILPVNQRLARHLPAPVTPSPQSTDELATPRLTRGPGLHTSPSAAQLEAEAASAAKSFFDVPTAPIPRVVTDAERHGFDDLEAAKDTYATVESPTYPDRVRLPQPRERREMQRVTGRPLYRRRTRRLRWQLGVILCVCSALAAAQGIQALTGSHAGETAAAPSSAPYMLVWAEGGAPLGQTATQQVSKSAVVTISAERPTTTVSMDLRETGVTPGPNLRLQGALKTSDESDLCGPITVSFNVRSIYATVTVGQVHPSHEVPVPTTVGPLKRYDRIAVTVDSPRHETQPCSIRLENFAIVST